MKTFQGQKEVG